MRLIRGLARLLLSVSLLAQAGCLYHFKGGGLPSAIRTVAVLPFDNLTPEPALTQEITRAVRDAVQNRLGLRASGEEQADAIVKGSIQRYEPDMPVSFTSSTTGDRAPDVTKRMVQISVTVQIIDQKNNKTIWERSGLMVQGEYDSGKEADGRRKALEKLTNEIVDGAQSQW